MLLSWFILTETRAEHPMLPLRLFANRNRSASNLMMLFVAAAMFAMFYFLTLFLQDVLGYSPLKAGLAFLPAAVLIIFSSIVIAQLIGRVGVRVPLIVGAAMIAGSFAWLTTLTVTSSYLDVLGPLIVLALGMGAIFVPANRHGRRGRAERGGGGGLGAAQHRPADRRRDRPGGALDDRDHGDPRP